MKKCKAILQMADDFGDNPITFHCQLSQGHEGPHREEGCLYDKFPYCITWEGDMTRPKISKREIEKYLSLPYHIRYKKDPDNDFYTIEVEELPGCITWAKTLKEGKNLIKKVMKDWIRRNLERGWEIPLPELAEEELKNH